jgi:hypothetical protein
MSNWVDMHLDALAKSPAEINQIERALQQPCDELVAWRPVVWRGPEGDCGQRQGDRVVQASTQSRLAAK